MCRRADIQVCCQYLGYIQSNSIQNDFLYLKSLNSFLQIETPVLTTRILPKVNLSPNPTYYNKEPIVKKEGVMKYWFLQGFSFFFSTTLTHWEVCVF